MNHLTATNLETKNKIITSFSAGKLRKNATKKISSLLSAATRIELKTQSMGMDDCFSMNEPRLIDEAEFWAWYESEYSDLEIYLCVKEGILLSAKFSDCPYHFSNDVVLTFEGVEKETVTAEHTPESTQSNTRKVVSLGDYQDRVESKRDRLQERAEKANADSDRYYADSKERASHIPFGQPILVGHHSEKRARRDADRIFNDMGKSVAASEKAAYLQDRAESVGTAGIASDDPEAIQKLKVKLTSLKTAQETMKAANKVIRSKHMSEDDKIEYMIKTLEFSEAHAKEVLAPDFCGRTGFASYQLQNNNATIRSTQVRIAELESLHKQKPLEGQGEIEGIIWVLYEEDGRIKFKFDDKPSDEVRTMIKSHGFNWSRYCSAWVRKITRNAVSSAQVLERKLTK